jgi:hypothetical protein
MGPAGGHNQLVARTQLRVYDAVTSTFTSTRTHSAHRPVQSCRLACPLQAGMTRCRYGHVIVIFLTGSYDTLSLRTRISDIPDKYDFEHLNNIQAELPPNGAPVCTTSVRLSLCHSAPCPFCWELWLCNMPILR